MTLLRSGTKAKHVKVVDPAEMQQPVLTSIEQLNKMITVYSKHAGLPKVASAVPVFPKRESESEMAHHPLRWRSAGASMISSRSQMVDNGRRLGRSVTSVPDFTVLGASDDCVPQNVLSSSLKGSARRSWGATALFSGHQKPQGAA